MTAPAEIVVAVMAAGFTAWIYRQLIRRIFQKPGLRHDRKEKGRLPKVCIDTTSA
jgi:hypothetical protein